MLVVSVVSVWAVLVLVLVLHEQSDLVGVTGWLVLFSHMCILPLLQRFSNSFGIAQQTTSMVLVVGLGNRSVAHRQKNRW
jgi:hypothetical protein